MNEEAKPPHDLTLERVNRLSRALADFMDSQAAQGRMLVGIMTRMDARLDRIDARLDGIEKAMRDLAGKQVLLGNRVETAFAQALRTNIRLDEIEKPGP